MVALTRITFGFTALFVSTVKCRRTDDEIKPLGPSNLGGTTLGEAMPRLWPHGSHPRYIIDEAKMEELQSKGVDPSIYEWKRWVPGSDANDSQTLQMPSLTGQGGNMPLQFERKASRLMANIRGSNSPAASSKKGLIWLHGLRPLSISGDFSGRMVDLELGEDWVVVRPEAPQAESKFLDGALASQWFDIQYSADPTGTCVGCPGSIESATRLVEAEIQKLRQSHSIAEDNIFLGGFSQGGALALYASTHSATPIKGVLSWAGYMVDTSSSPRWAGSDSSKKPKISILHGKHDDLVPFSWGEKAFDYFTQQDGLVNMDSYEDNFGHTDGLNVPQLKGKAKELLHSMASSTTENFASA